MTKLLNAYVRTNSELTKKYIIKMIEMRLKCMQIDTTTAKETLAKCLELENDYNIGKYTIYKEMVEMELLNYFCELMEEER